MNDILEQIGTIFCMDTSKQNDFPEYSDDTNVWDRERRSVTAPCNHAWENIYESDEGYCCGICSHLWVVEENSAPLLASARYFINSILDRLEKIENYLSESYDLTNCVACNRWDVRSKFVDLGSWFSCSEHVPLAVADGGDTAEVIRRAALFIKNSPVYHSRNIASVTLWEQLVAASSDLAEYLGDIDDELAASSPVVLPKIVQNVLGLQKNMSLRNLAKTIAEIIDAGAPCSRTSAAYLLTLLNEGYKIRLIKNRAKLDARVEEGLKEIALRFDDRYTEIAMELCGNGMQPGTVFDGEIANQALALLSRRAIYHFVDLFQAAR